MTLIAISTDDLETQRRYKKELGAKFHFVADPEGTLAVKYGVKTPVVTYAKRFTFVIDKGRKVAAVFSGGDALDPSGAIQAAAGLIKASPRPGKSP